MESVMSLMPYPEANNWYASVDSARREDTSQIDDGANPKRRMGRLKVPMLSGIPPAALAYFGVAMR